MRNAGGAAGNMPKINQGIVEGIPIPLPPLEEQRRIVAELDAEAAQMEAVRSLLPRFEAKIQRVLDRVWGTHGEAMFVVHLMQHKWGTEAPYPGYKTLAKRMGASDKTARRLAKSLEDKKYLQREIHEAQTNKFHLKKLIDALVALKKTHPKKKTHPARKHPTP